jgi:hypothetical protein
MNITMPRKEINISEVTSRCLTISGGTIPTKNDVMVMSMIMTRETGCDISTRLLDTIIYRHVLNGNIS